ncbi:MAG: hypothetical protein M3Y28_09675 [Armatimonadota bacterium]|nr:hypothetical protein [Armatimonadota bacterium]
MATLTAPAGNMHEITLHLPEDLYETAQEAVTLGLAASDTDFIEEAVRRRILEVRHARMRILAAEAMADPGFVADMHDTMNAFCYADAENWPEPESEYANAKDASP